MQKYLRELQPDKFDDLIAMNALYRPGPIEYIPNFIARKHGRESVVYDLPIMETYLSSTYGICVYQEQIMLLSQLLAGFGKGDADILRKAMGKKQIAVLDKMKGQFMAGATANGHPEKKLEKIWIDWEAFASYAFNKSHATCYAFVAYQTAYLKAHYPAEYLAGVLTNNQGNIEKVTFFMEECKRMSIPVKGPDVNESEQKFTVNKRGEIRYALAAIKGVGEGVVDTIVEERKKNGLYEDIFDFVRRSNPKSLNKRIMESLVQAGGFDGFESLTSSSNGDDVTLHRATYFAPSDKYDSFMEHLVKYAQAHQGQSGSAAVSLFGEMLDDISIPVPKIPRVEPWTLLNKLNRERDMTGIFLSGHPLDDFRAEIQSFTNCSLDKIEASKGRPIKIAGFVTTVEHRISKTGNGWGKFTIQDYIGQLEIVLFNDDYQRHKFLFEQGAALFITGIYEQRRFNGEWGFRIQDVRQLAGIADSLTQSITLRLALERITPELVEDLDRICTENTGPHSFKIMLLDAANRTSLSMIARERKVNASTQLTAALDRLGLDYKLN